MLKKQIKKIITNFRNKRPLRTQLLLITIFGDSILPHGGTVWLGSLIKLLEPFGINQRLVRTSVYRMTQEDWLVAEQIGRCSYYALTKNAAHKVHLAEQRIYSNVNYSWDGEWRLVFTGTSGVSKEERESLRKELLWQGFGQIAPNVFGHPVISIEPVLEMLEKMGLDKEVVVMLAKNYDGAHGPALQEMVKECCNLDYIENEYKKFIKNYLPIFKNIKDVKYLSNESCFLLRTMLIHDYRRILLRDPQLPSELLPENWSGILAREICVDMYKAISQKTEDHLISMCETSTGKFQEANYYFNSRFSK